MEKGALGLFFEMNHFVGIGLAIYISWFVAVMEKPSIGTKGLNEKDAADYNLMYNWIFFQYIWTIVCFFLSILVYSLYRGINKRIVKKQDDN